MNLQIEKLNLDKYILLKEKMSCIWSDKLYAKSGPIRISKDLQKQQIERSNVYEHQKSAYKKVLQFIKERKYTPVAEEKMLLDGLKLVLDNGWTVRAEELLELCDLCDLRSKVFASHEYAKFLEFMCVVAETFALDQLAVQNYFDVKR